ncbi:hypothetical protein R1sor_021575 [Riccia sorocarpa]|uniref:Probable RNA-binding protein 18 n=1 Tax=Riccia sorocarpa TaxID=122646 RepID=A0ABD3GN71_9MARC
MRLSVGFEAETYSPHRSSGGLWNNPSAAMSKRGREVDGDGVNGENRKNKLYIGNLDHRVTEYHVIKMFSPFGTIRCEEYMWHTHGPRRGEPRGFAFVEYCKREDAESAKASMNGRLAFGRPLVVRFVDEKAANENNVAPSRTTDSWLLGNKNLTRASTGSFITSKSAKIAVIQKKLKLMEKEEFQERENTSVKVGSSRELAYYHDLASTLFWGEVGTEQDDRLRRNDSCAVRSRANSAMTQIIQRTPLGCLLPRSCRSVEYASQASLVISMKVNARKISPQGRLSMHAPVRSSVGMSQEVKEIEALAIRLAKQAGAIIREKSGRATEVDRKSSRTDLVTEVDKACENLIFSEVQAVFPHHRWLGEETFTVDQLEHLRNSSDSDWTWLVDPIDGTLNFVGGLPFASVSIAVARGHDVQVGVVYNPFVDELFHAQQGQGAYLNGRAISALPHETELEDAIVTLGFSTNPETRKLMLEAISKVGPHCRTVRALGSAALHISYVAAGRIGVFFEHGLKPWDIAAARLILEEAGGSVTQINGEPLPVTGGSILATNGGIVHNRMVELLS